MSDCKLLNCNYVTENYNVTSFFWKGCRGCASLSLCKEREKIDHYQAKQEEMQKICNYGSVSVIPIEIGALEAVSKHEDMVW